MKVSIDKELEQLAREDKKKLDIDPINEVKLLLESNSTEDARILRSLSNGSQFSRIEQIRGNQIELEKHQAEFMGKVYTKNQIKSLAVDYNLRFLAAANYTGAFDVEVASKIKSFAKETNSPIDDYSLSRRYFILAPEQLFVLQDVKHIYKKDMDPAIFFQIDNEHYRLIHKWGKDFSILRYLSGFRWKGFYQHWAFNTALVLPIFAFILTFFFCLADEGTSLIANHWILFSLLTFVLSSIFSHFRWNYKKLDDWSIIHSYFSPDKWDNKNRMTY